MVDLEKPAPGAVDSTESQPPPRKKRRPLFVFGMLLAAFVVYAFAFQTTNVRLDEIQSETRQSQLFLILRALARPDLVTYDNEDAVVGIPVAVPCSAGEVPALPSDGGPEITLQPACADPGSLVTVAGSGFDPGASVQIQFVPQSDFDVVLPLGRFDVAEDGTLAAEVELPDRAADELQELRVVTAVRVGTWRDRVEVWTDTNDNGERDLAALPGEGRVAVESLTLPDFQLRDPGGVALIDENGNAVNFVSWGGAFEGSSGAATGLTSTDIGVDLAALGDNESISAIESTGTEPAWVVGPATLGEANPGQVYASSPAPGLFLNEMVIGGQPAVEIGGPPGADLRRNKLVFYDGIDGQQYKSVVLADQIDLSPRISDNAKLTWDKIVETVMLALLATTVGLLLAVPLSFFAARNLMRDISTPLVNLALTTIAVPVGALVGARIAGWTGNLTDPMAGSGWWALVGLVVLGAVEAALVRWAFQPDENAFTDSGRRWLRNGALIVLGVTLIGSLWLLSGLLQSVGNALESPLGVFGFLGRFVFKLGEILKVAIPVLTALVSAGALANVAGRIGYLARSRMSAGWVAAANIPLSMAAGGLWGLLIGGAVDWFGQFDNPVATRWVPMAFGAALGLLLAFRSRGRESVSIGLVVYYGARTLFNTLRSVEPLVMVIVFVVWVGIGPFAGALALALHTTAALAKLYSEQVESISHGPIEAIRATGATRMQTIVYAVVPQIIPPYISFTMYRWDINVRMSTIIGFAGGGGIGFLLQQNINLLQYRAAAAQMLAIAIVVASMDYISSRLRERFV